MTASVRRVHPPRPFYALSCKFCTRYLRGSEQDRTKRSKLRQAQRPLKKVGSAPRKAGYHGATSSRGSDCPASAPMRHMWTASWQALFFALNGLVGCGHMSGLVARRICPLALMKSDDQNPYQICELQLMSHNGLVTPIRACGPAGGQVARGMKRISHKGYRFPLEIIQQAIWLYVRFTLSFRDVEDLLAERGIMVSYETVRRWVNHFGPMIAANLRKRRPKPYTTWHLDEVYLKI